MKSPHRVVMFAPSPFSRVGICVLELLRREGVRTEAVVVRRLLDPRRFASELSRDGPRLLRKIYRKLVLRSAANPVRGEGTIVHFMARERIVDASIRAFCRRHAIEVASASDLNAPAVHEILDRVRPDCVVFVGGGLIRAPTLHRSGRGVINCHMGVLPRYRGMDVVEWALLEGRPAEVGLTTHLMDPGVDTGPILRVDRVAPDAFSGIGDLRNHLESRMPTLITQTCVDLLAGRIEPRSQRLEDGRQYFVMHPRLRPLAEQRLGATSRPR